MPRPNAKQRRRLKARAIGVTGSLDAFGWVMQFDRLNILVEGDSWVAYPKEWLVFGPNSNLANHVFSPLVNKGLINTLCLASNSHTAKQIVSGKQAAYLTRIFKKHGAKLDLMLFSAGGNDVLGPQDLKHLVKDYQAGDNASDCIHRPNFNAKLADIISRYQRLLDMRDKYAPQMQIICHTYDYVEPSDQAAEFLWGVEVAGPWIKPTFDRKNIPTDVGAQVIKQMLVEFRDALVKLQHQTNNRFHVVDTQGTLEPGNPAHWLNEIHPTPAGFKKLARLIYRQIRREFPQLPKFV